MNKKSIVAIIGMICGGVLLAGVSLVMVHRHNQIKKYNEIREDVVVESSQRTEPLTPETETEEPRIYCERKIDFDSLQEENGEIYAWIEIPGTDVSYPVLQSQTADYYLEKNLDGTDGLPGCIYSNEPDAKDFSDFADILYGHNMRDGSMFGALRAYYEEAFFQNNGTIYIYTPQNRFTYQIVLTQLHDDSYIPAEFDYFLADGSSRFIDYVQNVELTKPEEHRIAFEANTQDHFLVLSTCYKSDSKHRYILVAKQTQKAYYNE